MLPRLETTRLILRPFQESDLAAFAAYRSDPEVARYQSWEAPYTRAQAETFLEAMREVQPGTPGSWYQLALESKETGELLGDCAFCVRAEDPREAVIGFTLRPASQRQGLGTEAVRRLLAYLFAELALQRVRASCDAENHASARLLERLGMRRDGERDRTWFKGRWSTELQYAILREEWDAQGMGPHSA